MRNIKNAIKNVLALCLWLVPPYALWRIAKEHQEREKKCAADVVRCGQEILSAWMRQLHIDVRQLHIDALKESRDRALARGDMFMAAHYDDLVEEIEEDLLQKWIRSSA